MLLRKKGEEFRKLVPTEDFDEFSEDESPVSPTTVPDIAPLSPAIARSNDPPSIPPKKRAKTEKNEAKTEKTDFGGSQK